MTESVFDLIVIGGGINGAGIARDAARRGLRVGLFEKFDFGSGTSSWSSRLIHGGLRYLEYAELALVYESLGDRQALLETAPHLVKPLEITIPIYADARRGKWLVRAGMLAYDLLSLGKSLPNHKIRNTEATRNAFPGLASDQLQGSASYYDGQVEFAERLVLENIIDAQRHGAECRNYCEVVGLEIEASRITGIRFHDSQTGTVRRASADAVVNAGGPWVDSILGLANSNDFPVYMGGTKGSHIILSRFADAPTSALYAEAASDGRPFFILPWNDQILIGTTDIRDDTPPDALRPSVEEIDYLLAETNRLFPDADLGRDSVNHVYAGMRPLPRKTDGPESAITRAHVIKHHNHVARGLYSIIGGKLTTYRSLALDFLKRLARDSDRAYRRSDTDVAKLPGANALDELSQRATQTAWLSESGHAYLERVYGGLGLAILDLAEAEPALRETVCEHSGAIAAAVAYSAKNECACTLADVINRRTMLGLGPDRGLKCVDAVARLVASCWGWSDTKRDREAAVFREQTAERHLLLES